ncbi:hypothetical protein TNCV_4209681 [Trichonephila clavipes]|nr:hypothetical protein TNCV_4209681 [Trichonephila clavipes]
MKKKIASLKLNWSLRIRLSEFCDYFLYFRIVPRDGAASTTFFTIFQARFPTRTKTELFCTFYKFALASVIFTRQNCFYDGFSETEAEDSEFNISNSEDDSSDLSTDIFFESSESEDDDISSARMWVEEKQCVQLLLILILRKALEYW